MDKCRRHKWNYFIWKPKIMMSMALRIFRRCDHCGQTQIVQGNRRPRLCELPKETLLEVKMEDVARKIEEDFASSIFRGGPLLYIKGPYAKFYGG